MDFQGIGSIWLFLLEAVFDYLKTVKMHLVAIVVYSIYFNATQKAIKAYMSSRKEYGCFMNTRHGGGWQRTTNAPTRSISDHVISRNRTLQIYIRNVFGVIVFTQTVSNRLHEAGVRAKRPAVRVSLTDRHRQRAHA